MVDLIEPTLKVLKDNFAEHKTRSPAWRRNQLQQCEKGIEEMKNEICEAIFADLGRSNNATITCELTPCVVSIKHDLKYLKKYMAPIEEETELMLFPGKTQIIYEPLGVCAVYSAWNYPFLTCIKPVIQCICAGNAALIKPSEVAPATSAVVKKFVERYLDTDFYRVIEGGIDVAVKLNHQKLDLICFTGSTQVGKIVG